MDITQVTLSQSPEKQRALFGYAVADGAIFQTVESFMRAVGTFGWLNPHLTKLWMAIANYREAYGDRHPSLEELKSCPEILDNEAVIQKRLVQELESALKARLDFEYAAIASEMLLWRQDIKLTKGVEELARIHNRGEVAKAITMLGDLHYGLEELGNDVSNKLESSAVRLENEAELRKEDAKYLLSYGVKFLDEATGGIPRKGLVVIGAPTGVGKTQLISKIAEHNSARGKRVTVLALEAEVGEIERRLKYKYVYSAARAANFDTRKWSFQDWMLDKLPESDQFDGLAQERARQQLANVSTLYRNHGDFGLPELVRTISRAARDSDLIILDHLNYVDIDGANENVEVKNIVKRLRDLVLNHCKPIIVVAHLRKAPGGQQSPVVPRLDDFHGTSDVVKISTTVITISRPRDLEYAGPIPDGYATYMRVSKQRLGGGERVWPVAITYFRNGEYSDNYAIGELHNFDTEWYAMEKTPYWAEHANVKVASANVKKKKQRGSNL